MSKKSQKHDNITLSAKVMLRQTALRLLGDDPVIVETHGGRGDIWSAVYRDFPTGAVFEKDPGKADILAMQRPTWAVYEADVEIALAAGAARHLTVDLLDVDPYGAAWPALKAFFGSTRPLAPRMVVVVNDGLRFAACGGRGLFGFGLIRGSGFRLGGGRFLGIFVRFRRGFFRLAGGGLRIFLFVGGGGLRFGLGGRFFRFLFFRFFSKCHQCIDICHIFEIVLI
jgi:hypothetical protein